jgi:hypothetical protein
MKCMDAVSTLRQVAMSEWSFYFLLFHAKASKMADIQITFYH